MAERRSPGAVALGLALLALAGCSAGVPPTGKVTTVSRIELTNDRDLPGGRQGVRPTVGLKPAELVQEYLGVASPGDPDLAKPWVVPDKDATARLDAWSKHPSAWVYANPTPRSIIPARKGEATVVMEVSVIGHFDGLDWTPLAEERALEFKLRRVDTEWRIANPPSEPWMSEADFKERFRRMTLFMVSRGGQDRLVPAPTFFDQRAGASGVSEDDIQKQAEQVLRMLLEGPRGRLADGLDTAIPRGTRLESFRYQPSSGLATVNLSSDFAEPAGSRSGGLRVAQLVWTITELIRTAQVQIQVDGRQIETVGPDGFRVDRPYRGTAEELRSLWPMRPGSGSTVAFIRDSEVHTVPVDIPGAKPKVLPLLGAGGQKLHPVWSPSGDHIAYLISTGLTSDLELTTATAAGTEVTKTGLHGQLSEPTWVPAEPDRLLTLKRAGDRVELWSVTPGSGGKPVQLGLGNLPSGLEPSLLRVSPDGGMVLAVMRSRQGDGGRDQVTFGADSGQLYLGVLSSDGVTRWVAGPLAPGQGDAYSPVWADPETIAFIGEGGAKGSRALWTIRVDGWDPNLVLAADRSADGIDIADQLTVDPRGRTLVFKSSTDLSSSLWLVNVDGRGLRALTAGNRSLLDTDPNLASG